jgi:membrane-associated protease RseP (regulator of RpoE activity)
MSFWIGVLIFAVGILVSVCLHEAGHLLTAKGFGMKATQYFAGFGPTVFSFRRGETEYGFKAIPAGGFVKIVGMTPLEPVDPADSSRAFWRFPLWQRTVVLVAGSATHFLLALVIFYIAGVATGLPNPAYQSYDPMAAKPVIGVVSPCIVQGYELAKDGGLRACRASDPVSPATTAGLRHKDRIVLLDDQRIATYGELVRAIRATPPGPVDVTYLRGGERRTATLDLVPTQRPALEDTEGTGPLQTVSAVGVSPTYPRRILHYDAGSAIGGSVSFLGESIKQTFTAVAAFPSKIPKLFDAIGGQERDAETPISVVGASRIGGEAVELGAPIIFLALLGGLNVFIGVFNLFPLLPLDGGHVAIAWYERARSWLAARRGRPDPGRVDYNKLLPVTYVVILLFGGLTLLTLTADIVNPITLQ